ncbi:acyltransferase family protein, partial [Vibrio parahaemolyticus]
MLYSIQLLRGLAALLVVCTHSIFATISYGNNNSILSSFYNFSEFGAVGVDIFFVIS